MLFTRAFFRASVCGGQHAARVPVPDVFSGPIFGHHPGRIGVRFAGWRLVVLRIGRGGDGPLYNGFAGIAGGDRAAGAALVKAKKPGSRRAGDFGRQSGGFYFQPGLECCRRKTRTFPCEVVWGLWRRTGMQSGLAVHLSADHAVGRWFAAGNHGGQILPIRL